MPRSDVFCVILTVTLVAAYGSDRQAVGQPAVGTPEAETPAGIECKRQYEFDDNVYVTTKQYERRSGATAQKFSKLQSTKQRPVEVCGIPQELDFLTRLRCDDGLNPYPDRRAAHRSRLGSVGSGGRCGSIIDLYRVPCPEKTYEVYIDFYICPPRSPGYLVPWERYMAAGFEARRRDNHREALRYFRSAEFEAKTRAPEGPRMATTLTALAYVYQDQGRYAKAEPLYERALAIREKVLGPVHSAVADSLYNLGGLYKARGRYAEAEPLYRRALGIKENAHGPEDLAVSSTVRGLAQLSHAQGRDAEAESLFKRALAMREKAWGPGHPLVASSLNDLAGLYKSQGRYAEAEPVYKRALAISEKTLGPDDSGTAEVLNNLAELYRAQGRYAEAEPLYKRALMIREKALGPDQPEVVAQSLETYAALLRQTGRKAEAARMEARAEAIRARRAKENPAN